MYCEEELSLTENVGNSEQETPLMDKVETVEQGKGAVTKEETRSEMEKGGRKGCIFVKDTEISRAHNDGIDRDRQGKNLVVQPTL
ncbi:hypothetical protein ROHU_001325 [Labeo rohita]|uniref:Uncharacterized protein n=1 Tax=Labeo rohita TaxID=84645 RepID=A0A498P3U4_LABRO|nr:hypothetical protein ROHU_001325 [Labeo rohita]